MAFASRTESVYSGVVVDCAHEVKTCVELLQWRAATAGQKTAYSFLSSGEGEEASFTYGTLDCRARVVGAWLQRNCRPGSRVLLMFPSGLEYISAFFGCLYGGMIAVPVFPPGHNNGRQSHDRLSGIIPDADVSVVLTTTALLPRVRRFVSDSGVAIPVSALGRLEDSLSEQWRDPALDGKDIALLQYTSGSTSTPKGVMISHANILHNEHMIQQACAHTAESTFVGWLPFYHDMGLIGNILQPLYLGVQSILLSPMTFLQAPIRWLRAISHYRAHTSGGPNFAYELCVQKIAPGERTGLDLSCWKVAFNGAERVHAETLERFAAAFANCGFRYQAFFPCYGLAETTLMVSGSRTVAGPDISAPRARGPESGKAEDREPGSESVSVVSCGKPVVCADVLIVDPATGSPCPDGETGEIWVSSPAVSVGYWNKAKETEETFRAKLSLEDDRFFCRTQDIGFLHRGELFITGRYRDLIIIRGQNYHPEDIEWTIQESGIPVKHGSTAVFSVTIANEEKVVVLQEIASSEDWDGEVLATHIRSAVLQRHEVLTYAVAFVKMGALPKTTSGKIQRHLCRKEFLSGSHKPLWTSIASDGGSNAVPNVVITSKDLISKTPDEAISYLCSFLCRSLAYILKLPNIDAGQRIGSLGVDSLAAVEFKNLLETSLGIRVPLSRLFADLSIAQLAETIWQEIGKETEANGAEHSEPILESSLSYGQRSLWLTYQASPRSSVHRIARTMCIKGSKIPAKELQDAFFAVVERHSALRTTYFSIGTEVFQQEQKGNFQFEVLAAADWSFDKLMTRIRAEANRPFDLESGPILRVHLFQRGTAEDILLIVVHHIAADLWSFGLIVEQLDLLLRAAHERAEQHDKRSLLTSNYSEFVQWQARFLQSSEADAQLAYWQNYLSGDLLPVDLPGSGGTGQADGANGELHFTVDRRLSWQLRELCRKYDVTLHALYLAVFQAVLHRYSGGQEIIVSSPSHGRSLARFAASVGYFVNPLLRRGRFSRGLTFAHFLQATGRDVVSSLDRQDYPFGMLVQNTPKLRKLFGESKLAPQVNFTFQGILPHHNADLLSFALGIQNSVMRLGTAELELLPVENVESEFSLSLMMAEIENSAAGHFQYSTREFTCIQIERMKTHILNFLHEIAVNPEKSIDTVEYLSQAEKVQVIEEWNRTETEYPQNGCVHELFEEQAMLRPEAVAVSYADQQLSYGELNRRANQLGHYLRKLGVGPEVRVGVCVERSLEMVIGILGILKAGGAYVPMDAEYPGERLRYMEEDGQISVMVTQEHLRKRLPVSGVPMVSLGKEWEQIEEESVENVEGSGAGAENLAYVMYTSGSTGEAKGVGVIHRGIVRLVRGGEYVKWEEGDVGLQMAPLIFDASTFEIWGVLLNGGRLEVYGRGMVELKEVGKVVVERGVEVLWLTAGLFQRMVEEEGESLRGVRELVAGGDVLGVETVRKALRDGCCVINGYGPTENTTFSSCQRLEGLRGKEKLVRGRVPIGNPIGNTQAYVLDDEMEAVGIGVEGDLYLGGAGLARGYWRRAALTAEKFVPNPYSRRGGERLYRSGDRVRWLESGELEFVGRLDDQVKVRGYRVELREIEAVLQQHVGVKQAGVVVKGNGVEKRLVGYVMMREGMQGREAELRKYLQERLPEYMVPSGIVQLEKMPLTVNGKIDRKALVEVEEAEEGRGSSYVGPRNATEEIVAEIWEEVLKRERIGIHDNFFSLGGDSLLGMKLCSDLQAALVIEKPLLPILLTNPTIAQLAEQLQVNHPAS